LQDEPLKADVWLLEDEATDAAADAGPTADTVRRALESAAPVAFGRSDEERDAHGLAAPVLEVRSGAAVAVVAFEREGVSFGPDEERAATVYASAVGHALTVPVPGPTGASARRKAPIDPASAGILGHSPATRELLATLDAILPSTNRPDAPPILVTGASGTGKELVAQYLHRNSERRRNGPFVSFNCAAARGDTLESRLFGHVKGAFTGAIADQPGFFRAADKGVLFLDELGDMPLEAQALLLRALETRRIQPLGSVREVPVDVLVIAATNADLEKAVASGQFRRDLYFRLAGLLVELVPLSWPSRLPDLPVLAAYYIDLHERALGYRTRGLMPETLAALRHYEWPGNVRELSTVCQKLVTFTRPGEPIDLPRARRACREIFDGPRNPHVEVQLLDEDITYGDAVRILRSVLVEQRLKRFGQNVNAAAQSLRLSTATFYRYGGRARER
jgi:transcriptional regulator with PAS, ATPase and Fis domain